MAPKSSYAESVLREIAAHDGVMQQLDSSVAAIQHVSRHTDDGVVRLDSCPCARDESGLPVDDIGRPVVPLLGEGHYVSSATHTLADLVRDVLAGA